MFICQTKGTKEDVEIVTAVQGPEERAVKIQEITAYSFDPEIVEL